MKFIGYIPFGYPSIAESIQYIDAYCDAGCEAVEISIPVYDPIDESDMITDFMRKALQKCPDYDQYLEGIQRVRKNYSSLEINLLLFTETINKIGLEQILDFYHKCNVFTVICPDIGENKEMKSILEKGGMKFSAPIHYDLQADELTNSIESTGFVYMQAFPSMGQKTIKDLETPDKIIKLLKDHGVKQQIYAGVGIKTIDDVKEIKKAGADAFFVGGTLMKIMNDKELLIKTIKEFINAGK